MTTTKEQRKAWRDEYMASGRCPGCDGELPVHRPIVRADNTVTRCSWGDTMALLDDLELAEKDVARENARADEWEARAEKTEADNVACADDAIAANVKSDALDAKLEDYEHVLLTCGMLPRATQFHKEQAQHRAALAKLEGTLRRARA